MQFPDFTQSILSMQGSRFDDLVLDRVIAYITQKGTEKSWRPAANWSERPP
jgi:hypothetical protein